MKLDILKELGALAIASRLKRMSDSIMINGREIYQYHSVDFEPRFFPLYYYLSINEPTGIMEIADNLKISHPAVIQIAKELEKRGLIMAIKSKTDARKRLLTLSKLGKKMLPKMKAIWEQINEMNQQIISLQSPNILEALEALELAWPSHNYMEVFKNKYPSLA